jgi:hypothetical protein
VIPPVVALTGCTATSLPALEVPLIAPLLRSLRRAGGFAFRRDMRVFNGLREGSGFIP